MRIIVTSIMSVTHDTCHMSVIMPVTQIHIDIQQFNRYFLFFTHCLPVQVPPTAYLVLKVIHCCQGHHNNDMLLLNVSDNHSLDHINVQLPLK